MDNKHVYAVILAGGEGVRFAPFSTPEFPKQFLKITDPKKSLIRQTYDRVSSFVRTDHIMISTSSKYLHLVASQFPGLPLSRIIGEPMKKNTAPPIALLTGLIHKHDVQSVVFFFPSDHYIRNSENARQIFSEAAKLAAKNEMLITFGIPPDFPSPEYGYIQREEKPFSQNAYRIRSFKEKPNVQTAKQYLAGENYYWNSGIFCWSSSFFLKKIRDYMPALSSELDNITFSKDGGVNPHWLKKYFEKAESISIDYALMEKTRDAVVIPMNAGWSDIGTWQGLGKLARKYSLNLPPEVLEYIKGI